MLDEIKHKYFLERGVCLFRFCSRTYEVQRNAGRLFWHEHPWTTRSWDTSFVGEMRDKGDVYEAKVTYAR